MNDINMDTLFASEFRETLVAHVSKRAKRPRRKIVWAGAGLMSLIAISGAGVATASLTAPPGTPVYAPVSNSMSETFSKSGELTLGAPPADANSISFDAVCLSEGTFWVENYGGIACSSDDLGSTKHGAVELSLWQQSTIKLDLEPGLKVELSATFSREVQTEWGTNQAGETYGAQKQNKMAELAAATATNGQSGYVRISEVNAATIDPTKSSLEDVQKHLASGDGRPDRYVPVYEADGKTVIGQYLIAGYDTQERLTQEQSDQGFDLGFTPSNE
ncbi:hypothetical protein [Herbiconiux sp. VKM Ac-2851]|uniref:hypothetical protein n=1 Tax=Herbiconiux sp. VKM Ac-2851 TaxID=2739025 RepID=UPI0015642C18|nr:hypothetical protein [Herbiconiux sp. VKM Ac-2851]NQX34477.1 hypothetical protein [Herbiconiux sp. VKM Ac-2851]